MRVKNTSKRDLAEIKTLLAFAAKNVNDNGVEVHVKNSSGRWRGYAYEKPHENGYVNIALTTVYLITLGIPDHVPETTWTSLEGIKKLWPDGIPLESWQDVFLWIAAHEFYHTKRFRAGKLKGSEYRPEKFANTRLNQWRVYTGREAIEPIKQPNPFEGINTPV